VSDYISYMDFIITDMAEVCTAAATLLEEDKYMKQAFEEQEALRMAQEMSRLAAMGNEYVYPCASVVGVRVRVRVRVRVCVRVRVLAPCNCSW
jgi:hypothetical protein